MSIVYLNGDFIPDDKACIPVLDRGFIFGDGVYEVIPVYGAKTFRLREHLQRLQNSLDNIRLPNPHTLDQWQNIIDTLVEKNNGGDLSLYLQVTRGVAQRDHAIPESVTPTVFCMCNPIFPVSDQIRRQGVAAITVEDIRWQYCHIKAIALLPNILLRQQAIDSGAMEAILIRDGKVTEGAASNIFAVINGTLCTPAKGPQLLPGITRDLVMELAHDHNMSCEEREIDASELVQAQEIWLTSSTKEILPVTKLDDEPVGSGKPGAMWTQMIELYQEHKKTLGQGGQSND